MEGMIDALQAALCIGCDGLAYHLSQNACTRSIFFSCIAVHRLESVTLCRSWIPCVVYALKQFTPKVFSVNVDDRCLEAKHLTNQATKNTFTSGVPLCGSLQTICIRPIYETVLFRYVKGDSTHSAQMAYYRCALAVEIRPL